MKLEEVVERFRRALKEDEELLDAIADRVIQRQRKEKAEGETKSEKWEGWS